MSYGQSSDRLLFITVSVLTLFGLLMVYSASSVVASLQTGRSSYFLFRQGTYAIAGYLLMIRLMNVDYHFWQRRRVVILLAVFCILSLALVFTQPPINGAHRWFRFGALISFQPSEFAKLSLLIYLAHFLQKNGTLIDSPGVRLLPCLGIVGLFAGLIGAEPDLGQAVCVSLIAALLLFVAGLSWKHIGISLLAALPALILLLWRTPYHVERIKTFLNQSQGAHHAGWQSLQARIALGSGGLFGIGFGNGRQKFLFLPTPHSDFIYAIIGEELGLAGTLLIAAAFLIFLFRGLRTALSAPDRFGFYLALGITLMVVLPAFINMSMVLALLPTKGIALPFISQGGSSLLFNLMATGILLNISIKGLQSDR